MNRFIVDGALEEISQSQGNSPIFNILEAAAVASGCAAAALIRTQEGFDQIEACYGPLVAFQKMKVPNSAVDRELINDYIVVKGAPKYPKLAISKLIQEPLGVQFLASAPIALGAGETQMQLIVADNREGVRRSPNLKQTLESYANLTAAVILQSGGRAYRSKRQRDNQDYLGQISSLLVQAPTKVILTDDSFQVLERSLGFESFAKTRGIEDFSNLSDFFSSDWTRVLNMLESMKVENKAIDAISVTLEEEQSSALCVALLIPESKPGEVTFSIDIRQSFEESNIDELTSKPQDLGDLESKYLKGGIVPKNGFSFQEDDPTPLSNFLLETLVENNRIHSSSGVSYHSLRRWRQPIRVWQIAAFKNLKRNPSEAFLASAALELSEAALSIMGAGAFDYVVPVACGNSGVGCFAEKVSERVAKLLSIEHVVVFHPLAVSGNSHPKRNVKRPKMKLREKVKGRILLLDDIATSGSHLVEATKLLRGQDTTVLPIAWVSA